MGGGTSHLAAFETSLALASERGDPAARIYSRLFAALPETERLFQRDTSGAIRAHMLYEALEAVRDLLSVRAYAPHWIVAEYVNHQGMDVPGDAYARFFDAIAEGLEESLGPAWTGAMRDAWAAARAEIAALVAARGAVDPHPQGAGI